MKGKIYLLLIVITLFIPGNCKQQVESNHLRFKDNNEDYNYARLFYIEKNYKKALKYINKSGKKDIYALYLKSKIYFKLKQYNKSLSILTNLKNNSEIKDFINILKYENLYFLNQYQKIIKDSNDVNIKNFYLKTRFYYILASSYYYNNDFENSYFYFKKLINNYSKIKRWKIRKYIIEDYNIFFKKFTDVLLHTKKYYELFNFIIKNINKIKKKERKKFLQSNKNILISSVKREKIDKIFSFAKILYYNNFIPEAESLFKTIILRDKKNSEIKLKSYYFLSIINKNNNLFNYYLNNIIILYDNSDIANFYIGKAYLIKGEKENAIHYFSNLTNTKNKNIFVKSAFLELLKINKKNKESEKKLIFNLYKRFKDYETSKLFYRYGLKNLNKNNINSAEKVFILLLKNKYFKVPSYFFAGKIYYIKKEFNKSYKYFNKYLKVSSLNYYFIETGKYIKSIYKREWEINNIYTTYFIKHKKPKLSYNFNKIIKGKIFYSIYNLTDFKIMKKLFNNGLTFEGKLMFYKIKSKLNKNNDILKLYYTSLNYYYKAHIVNEVLNMRIAILKREKKYKNIIFLSSDKLRILFPLYYKTYIKIISKKYNVKEEYIYSLVYAESLFNIEATSIDNAIGLFQLLPSTAKLVSKKLNMNDTNLTFYNPLYNTQLGIKYLHILLKKYRNDYILALSAYNAGSGNVNKWLKKYSYNSKIKESFIELIPFTETKNYIKRILLYKYFYTKVLNNN